MNAIAVLNEAGGTLATMTPSTGTLQCRVAREPVGHDFGRMASQSLRPYRKQESWNVAAFPLPSLDGPRIPPSPLHEF
jgi:hypothetical protein